MASVLSTFFSRDPKSSFSYEIPLESFTSYRGFLLGNSFKKAEPNEKATCFWSVDNASALKIQAQKLKTLRHPNVLAYFDYLEVADKAYLITEPCEPVEHYFNHIKLSPSQKELFVSWGIYQILTCLKFLHNEVKMSQNNMAESIYITASGDWKLSGFQNTAPLIKFSDDLKDLGIVIFQIFNGFSTSYNPKSTGQIPQRCLSIYKKLVSPTSNKSADQLLSEGRASGGFMQNKFVNTLLFLDEFQLKDSADKQNFLSNLKDNLDMFPDDVAKRKILPKIIHCYEYGDAGSHILLPMFKLGQLLDNDEYQYRIVPCLVKLFSSSDRSTRVKLLEKIDEFAVHLRPDVINESIYGNLVTGFNDTNPAVRESTVKAMVSIADKLNYHNLNNDLMRYLARMQGSDDQPGIRTNTTICLGKIGCYIDASHRQRILISAFTRALKDPFPPARIAGVLSLSATQQYYSLKEVAAKILPSLAPLTMDPEKQVRDQGFKALKGFLENLEKASENPEIISELEANVNAGGRSGLLSGDKVPQWAGWALKAISGKFYKSTGESSAQPTAAVEATDAASVTSSAETPANGRRVAKVLEERDKSTVSDAWTELNDNDGGVDSANDWKDDEDATLAKSTAMKSVVATKSSAKSAFKDFGSGWMDVIEDDTLSTAAKDDGWSTDFIDLNSQPKTEEKKSIIRPTGCSGESSSMSAKSINAKKPRPESKPKAETRLKKSGPLKLGAKRITTKIPTASDHDLLN